MSDNLVLWIFAAAGVLAMVGFLVDQLTDVLHKFPRLIKALRDIWRTIRGKDSDDQPPKPREKADVDP